MSANAPDIVAELAHVKDALALAERENAKLTLDNDILKSALKTRLLPCGHSDQYAYTEDGGKHIVCLPCKIKKLDDELTLAKIRVDILEDEKRKHLRGELTWHQVVVECEKIFSCDDTAENPLMSNLPNLVRALRSDYTNLQTMHVELLKKYRTLYDAAKPVSEWWNDDSEGMPTSTALTSYIGALSPEEGARLDALSQAIGDALL